MKFSLALAALAVSSTLFAQVKSVESPLPLDGKLAGNGWESVPEQTGFQYLKAKGTDKLPDVQTSFRAAVDKDALYVTVHCFDPEPEKVNTSSGADLWVTDSVELFLSPSGQPDDYYQFVTTAGGKHCSMYYAEAGNITPDPYFPQWESAAFPCKDGYLVQFRIPFSAFYMTRNAAWSSTWLVNVVRNRLSRPGLEHTTWSPLVSKFHESRNFRKVAGFPLRDPAQDAAVLKVVPSIRSFENGVYSGPLDLTVMADPAAAGEYDLQVTEPGGKTSRHTVTLKGGMNTVCLPHVEYLKKAEGKTLLELTLTNRKTGVSFGRSYPVDISWQPVTVRLATPSFKHNFYPGQDFSKIQGELILNLSDEQKKNAEVVLSLAGGGLNEAVRKFKADSDVVPFSFESGALTEGGRAVLTAKVLICGVEAAASTCTVTRLKKNEGSMLWIENGVIMKNGKPWYPREIYARGYRGGRAFAERYNADDLAESAFRQASVEPRRMIHDSESKEARRDVKPSPEMFEAVRKVVEANRSKPEFDFYYICDEPECRGISPVYLKYIYDFVSGLDPYHPVFTCTRAADKYIDCADIFSVHPYIAPIENAGKRFLTLPVRRVRDYLRDVTQFHRPDKIAGFTGQFFSYKFNNWMADYPTWEELESMSWSAIANGSRFQYPYAYHDLGDRPQIYEGYRYFNQCIQALEPLLLSNNKLPVQAVDPENMIDTLLVEADGTTLLIVVNLKNAPLETVISSEHLKKFDSLLEFRGTGTQKPVNGELRLELKPYECVILTSKKMDEGLKTRSQVLADVAEAEKIRSSRGSLLFEKGSAFEVDSSNPAGGTLGTQAIRIKMFDGTPDMLAWESNRWAKENWFELDFYRNPPKFSKIGVYGRFGDGLKVRIWKFGEWKELTPRSVSKEKYSAVLDFGEELKSVKVRLDLSPAPGAQTVELYEIELLK